jgi:predicted membrane metal-binding protein
MDPKKQTKVFKGLIKRFGTSKFLVIIGLIMALLAGLIGPMVGLLLA